jgi:hypothetical protein
MKHVVGPTPAVNGVIEHIITADDPFGEPWPPDGFCSVVRRARGFTLWRRISLQSSSVTFGAASPEDQLRAP